MKPKSKLHSVLAMASAPLLKHLALALMLGAGLGAGSAQAQFVDVSGAGVIGDTVLTTSASTAVLPTYSSWRVNNNTGNTYNTLKAPAVAVTANGNVTLTFTHRHNFENGYDGGAVYVSVDGAPATYLPASSFTSNGYNITGQPASFGSAWPDTLIFSSTSTGYSTPAYITTVANLGSLNAGQTISVEFVGKWDGGVNIPSPSWEIGTFKLTDGAATDIAEYDFNVDGASGFTQTSGNHSAGTGTPVPWVHTTGNIALNKFEINGDTLASDRYKTDFAGTINLTGAIIEVILLAGTLETNDTFALFDLSNGSTITGTPASVTLPVIPGVIWDKTQLGVNGTIKVFQALPASGSWKDVTGNWFDAPNWTATVAYGADQTASFNANITANRTVTLDRDTSIGNITKADATPSDHMLTISGSKLLTLDTTSGSPVITNSDTAASARRLEIACSIAGTDGLTKAGTGALRLTNNTSSWTGNTTVNGGWLDLGGIPNANIGGGTGAGRNITIATGASVRFDGLSNAFLNRIVETSDTIGIWTGPGGATSFNSNNLDFSSSTGANLPNAFLGCWTSNGSPTIYTGVITPASDNYRFGFANSVGFLGITSAHGGTQGLLVGASPVVLTGSNTFTGDTVINTSGRLFIGQNLALQNSALDTTLGGLSLHNTPGASNCPGAALADAPVLGGLKGTRNFVTMLSTVAQNNTTSLAAVFVKGLTLNPGTGKSHTYTGAITEMAPGTYVTKTGQGSQTLSGADTHTGITSVNEGTLVIGNAKALGSGGPAAASTGQTNVASGATLDLNGITAVNEPITLSGDGVGGNGALVNNSVSPASITNGVASLQLPSASTGSGYGTAPTVAISGTGTGATATVSRGLTTASFVVNVSGNRVYTVAPVITITGGGTGAAGATAVPILSGGTTGTVTGLTITAPGYGYSAAATATVSGGTSTGSTTTTFTGITITAQDVSNATATGFTGTVTFGGTGGFTGTSASFTAGVLSGVSVTPTVAGSNLTFTVDDGATHTGSTTIATINPAGSPYEIWATGSEPFDGDANGDGVKDGLAFLLGAATPSENAIGRLPIVTESGGGLVLTFNCLPVAARGNATLKVAHSNNLTAWTTTVDVVPDADDAVPDNNVTFVVGAGPVGPPALKTVTATIGSGAAAAGKLFGRLEAVHP